MNKVGETLVHFGGNKALIEALVEYNVEFLLIGGLAVSWYCKEREADDMDLLVCSSPENSERIYNALSSLHLKGFTPASFSRTSVQAPLKNETLYAELLTTKHNMPSYTECSENKVKGKLFDIPINIISLKSLLRLKEIAANQHADASENESATKHLNDIQLLLK